MWMTPDPITVEPSTPVSEVARLMALRHVRRVVVTAPGSRGRSVVGIVSSHDVWQACPPGHHPLSAAPWPGGTDPGVGSIMTATVQVVGPDTPIETAARLLRKHKIGAMPVVREGRLVGIVTESDLLDVLVEMTGDGEPGLRVSFELDDEDDVVRALLEIADRHGMRLASMLTFAHPDRERGTRLRLGVARLLGVEQPGLVDAIWSRCRRVRRVLRDGAARAGDGDGDDAASAVRTRTNRSGPAFRRMGGEDRR